VYLWNIQKHWSKKLSQPCDSIADFTRLGLELPGTMFRELVQEVFWIASASLPGVIAQGSNSFLRTNPNAFPDLWESALLSPVVQNNEALIGMSKQVDLIQIQWLIITGQMIDIMLLSETNIENPLAKSPECNAFAIRSLSKLPLDVFARKDRKRIRQGWLHAPKTRTHKSKKKAVSGDGDEETRQSPSYELTALNPEVLALKVKIMQLPTSYEVRMVNMYPFSIR
jgi:nucleolar pre-ribosomal-associated protein 2